jgi:type II secretory pathway component PulJ
VATGLAATISVGLFSFLGPMLGVRRRLLEEREEELERVRVRIGMHVAAAPTIRVDSADSLADLLAWEERLGRAAVWPIDAGTLGRFGLYVTLGLAAWVGAALVERVLGVALGQPG